MIFTFYSYKGGVGRTHLLANLAAYLCHYQKKKVLLIDWDLEAPGLHFYFDKKNEDIQSKGLINLLNKHMEVFRNSDKEVLNEEDFFNPFESEESYFQNLVATENGGKIDLMPAIAYLEGYHTEIEDFDWTKNYYQYYIGSYLLWLKEQLKRKYDYVLIDSRTGFNDYSGICNVLMPDMNILVVAPNEQNFEGAKKMAMRIIESEFTKSDARKPFILPILSRLDNEHEDADKWRVRFAETFAFLIPKLDQDLRAFGKEILQILSAQTTLLYNRRFAIGEKIQFNPTAEPVIEGSPLEVFQNIALNFLEKMNNTGEIDINKMVGNKMIPIYLRKIEENPKDYEAYFGLGFAYQDLGNNKEAKKYYLKAIDVKSELHKAWNNLGVVYNNLQQYEDAIDTYQKALAIKPNFYEAWYNLGLVYAQGLQQYEQAKEAFQKAIEIEPDYHEAWYNLGNVYDNLQQYEQAIDAYQKAIEIEPDYHEAWYNLGIVYKNLQQYEQAIEAYQKAIDIEPEDHEAWNNLGSVYAQGLQQYEQAIEAYQKAIKIKPDLHETWNNLGIVYFNLQDYPKAIDAYQKAIEIKPEYHEAWNNLGSVYFNLQQYEAAENAYQKVIEIKPEYHEAWNNLGLVYFNLQQYEAAENAYQKAIEIKPNFHEAWYNLGLVYFNLQQYEAAENAYQKAIEIKPEDHEAWYNLGNVYAAQKEYTKAKECFEKALEIKPDKEEAFFNLACTYSLEKNKEKALEYLQKAIELAPTNKEKAQEDPDFEWLWADVDFLKIIN